MYPIVMGSLFLSVRVNILSIARVTLILEWAATQRRCKVPASHLRLLLSFVLIRRNNACSQ